MKLTKEQEEEVNKSLFRTMHLSALWTIAMVLSESFPITFVCALLAIFFFGAGFLTIRDALKEDSRP